MKEEIASSYLDTVKRNFGNVAELLNTENRRALVVGADNPGSIGREVVKALSVAGFKEVWSPKRTDFDVRRYAKMKQWLWDKPLIDTLVLCHGVTHLAWFEDQMQEDIEHVVDVNLTGTMLALNAFVNRTMSERHVRKHIVVIGSMAHKNVLNASAPYCATKAGVAMLVRCLGWELTPKGYWIYGVHPSNVENTPMAEDTIQGIVEYRHIDHTAARAYWGALNLMPRWLRAGDVADVVAWLVQGSAAAAWQSGTNIELPGGQR